MIGQQVNTWHTFDTEHLERSVDIGDIPRRGMAALTPEEVLFFKEEGVRHAIHCSAARCSRCCLRRAIHRRRRPYHICCSKEKHQRRGAA